MWLCYFFLYNMKSSLILQKSILLVNKLTNVLFTTWPSSCRCECGHSEHSMQWHVRSAGHCQCLPILYMLHTTLEYCTLLKFTVLQFNVMRQQWHQLFGLQLPHNYIANCVFFTNKMFRHCTNYNFKCMSISYTEINLMSLILST